MKTMPSASIVLTLILASTAATAESAEYKLRVSGLACPFCAYGLEKKLNAISGVEKVTVDIEKGMAVVSMAEGAALDEELARKAVREAGFTVNSVEATGAEEPSGSPKGNLR